MKKRIISLLMALVLAFSLLPTAAFAADHADQVRVIVENTTYTAADAPWTGTLVDKWVDLKSDSTMMSCMVDALGSYPQTGAESNYISEINGLSSQGGAMSGWMGTLNDWFTNEGFGAFTAAKGTLKAGDEIRIMYTCNYGEDLGGSWSNTDKTVKNVAFSAGTLDKAFEKNTHEYTLTIPADVSSVVVTPTASNKNYQVRTSVGGTEYARTAEVPVADGAVITVKCGDPSWPSMNPNDGEAQSYTFKVEQEGANRAPTIRGDAAAEATLEVGMSYTLDLSKIFVDVNGDELTYQVSVNGAKAAAAAPSYTYTPDAAGTVTLAFTASDGALTSEPYTVTLHVYEKGHAYPFEFKGLHNAQLSDIKVYTYTDGVKGTQNLLEGKSTEADGYKLKYTTELAAGDYWVDGYDANGDFNGGTVISVAVGGGEVTLGRVYQIYASNSGWVKDTDYSVSYQLVMADGTERESTLGTADSWGTVYTSGLYAAGDTVNATLTPIGDKAAGYLATTVTKTTDASSGGLSMSASVPAAIDVTVTAPAGSSISTGTFGSYYTYQFFTAESVENVGGNVKATFRVPTSSYNHFLRVQNPDGVTYWTFAKWTSAQDITVTKEDLHIGEKDCTKDSVYRFDKNMYDRAGIYLNVNRQGYINMESGATRELDAFRNWQAIESFSNSQIALPDMHYQVIDFDGNPSDVVFVTPDANNSGLATLTANKAGTAIVLVTYDAMTHMQGQSSTDSKVFSAIWPELTGVFVVSVDNDGSAIETNTFLDRMNANVTKDEQKYIDAEHDILFYLGNAGASYTFTPESGTTVSVARSTVSDKLTFSGFTTDGVAVDSETGAVTVTGLTTGRHIIRVEKNGTATYQVVTARQVSYDLVDADGNVLPANTEYKAGDKVYVQFHDLISPKEKLSGVYNFNFSLYYEGENGTFFQSKPGSPFGVYDFSGNPVRQLIEITIPEGWTDLAYDLTGAIKVGGFGGVPTHRGVSYTKGIDRQYGTSAAAVLAQLPALSLKLEGWHVNDAIEKINAIGTVTPDSGDAIAAARSAYDALTDAQKEQVTNADTLTAAEARYTDVIAIDGVEKAIDAIGEVTLTSGDAIAAARAAYDALTDSQKAEVNNYNTLLAAEARLAELEDAAARAAYAENAYQTTGDLLETLGTPNVGSVGGEWMVIGLARSGRTVPDGYYENVVKYVQENCDADERLDENRATDNARVILALTSIGKDVTNVGGHNLLAGLDEMSYVTYQGINGPIWTLIALDSHDYAPQGDVTREKLIDAILGAQLPDGGWDMMGKAADTDITAMAIQALAPYYDTNDAVKAAVDKALDALSAMQNDDGTFSTAFSGKTSESTAQVIVALTALGINPATDSRFIKNGLNAVDGLCSFYVDGGGFRHIASGDLDGMATEQSYYALAAYYRLLAGQTSLYDMSDVTITPAPVTPDQPTNPDKPSTGDRGVMLWVAALGVSGLAAAAVVGSKKREEA